MSDLDGEERAMVELKLQDYTHGEIAVKLACSERTVRRLVRRVRDRWRGQDICGRPWGRRRRRNGERR